MLESLKELDESLFLFLNGLHSSWMDPVMVFFSAKLVWIPLYLSIIGAIVYQHRKKAIIYILGIILTVALADQITSGYMKPTFERLRPCREAHLQPLVHTVKKCGGKYGFASSHAANTFGLAFFCFLLWRRKWRTISIVLLIWAAIVSYSRVYLGVHYPGDILVGGLVGIWLAAAMYWVTLSIIQKTLRPYIHI